VLPPESAVFEALVERFGALARAAGYGLVLLPLFEDAAVFSRGIGEGTDVVAKEMYEFFDRGGRRLALRPEVTASVARAYCQHRPPLPWKVWYWGPNFRYEHAQAGRYRQFYQAGAEALGSEDPDLDVELVALAWRFTGEAGLRSVRLLLNSLGDEACRPAYRGALVSYLRSRRDELCAEHRDLVERNPLRVLDCKTEACRLATAGAPRPLDALCEACAAHFARVREGLDALGIPAVLEPRLVRGLDYYTRTTFELVADALDAAQDAIGGGGRYDGLVEALGGPPTPGIGFSVGLDRTVLALSAEGGPLPAPPAPDAFVVDLVGGSEARVLAEELRRAGLAAERAFDGRSLRAQLRLADRSGAAVALIVGEAEQASGTVTVRALREEARAALRLLSGATPGATGGEAAISGAGVAGTASTERAGTGSAEHGGTASAEDGQVRVARREAVASVRALVRRGEAT
jgi:histidyl-tRNA synthetase